MFEVLMMVSQSVDLSALGQVIVDYGIFGGLFSWLLWDTRQEAKGREDRLMNHIDKQEVALDKVTDTIERMDTRLSVIEDKVKETTK